MVQLNRLQANLASLNYANSGEQNSKRKARTRTLIQLGGLINLSGLLEYCNIQLGTDLQSNVYENHGVTLLMGALVETLVQLQNYPENNQNLENIGSNLLKQHAAKKYFTKLN